MQNSNKWNNENSRSYLQVFSIAVPRPATLVGSKGVTGSAIGELWLCRESR